MMSFLTTLCHPITIAFSVIAIGLCIGKIKVWNISLDLAAVLIVAVVIGYLLNTLNGITDILQMNSYMKMFSTLGTALFVSVVGVTAGYSLNSKSTRKLSSAVIGMLMIISAFITINTISKFNIRISYSDLLGILCGALTTTPGLSAVCEKSGITSEEATLSYGGAYLFGVIFTVLAVQVITRKAVLKVKTQVSAETKANNAGFCGLMQISIVIVFGKFLGILNVPYISFSLGDSGGMLCTGILIGYLIGKYFKDRCISKAQQSIFRSIGLVFFFIGNGIPAGMQIKNNFSVVAVFIGVILTVVPIATGWFICKVFLKKSNIDTATIISGGMTSTPAIGVLGAKTNVAYTEYSFAYVAALFTIIILLRLL